MSEMYIFILFFSFVTWISVVNDIFLFQKGFFFTHSLQFPPIFHRYHLFIIKLCSSFDPLWLHCVHFSISIFFSRLLPLILFGHIMFKGYHKLFITKYTIFPFFPPSNHELFMKIGGFSLRMSVRVLYFYYFHSFPPVVFHTSYRMRFHSINSVKIVCVMRIIFVLALADKEPGTRNYFFVRMGKRTQLHDLSSVSFFLKTTKIHFCFCCSFSLYT